MPLLSTTFLLLLAAAVAIFHALPPRWRPAYLLILSYGYYATWGLRFVPVLAGATLIAYVAARRIEAGSSTPGGTGRWILPAAILSLSTILVAFKYLPPLLAWLGGAGAVAGIVAPLGLSYFTFKLLGYVLDVEWGKIPAERSLVAFATSVAFFPQIVSGPIHRCGDFLAALHRRAPVPRETVAGGLRLVLFGAFEKFVVADRLGWVVDNVFDAPGDASGLGFLVGAYAFALQIYADLSAVTDVALGIGRLFGVEGPPNFDLPFLSPNLPEFWRRWHISLTSWLTEYLFMPLRMATRRLGSAGLALSILLNMLAVGLWHGASLSCVVFGLLNGVFMVVSAFTLKRRDRYFAARPLAARLRTVAAPVLTFHLVAAALVFFRARSVPVALDALRHVVADLRFTGAGDELRRIGVTGRFTVVLCGVAVMECVQLARHYPGLAARFAASPRWLRWASYYALIVAIVVLRRRYGHGFIYAEF